jgi:hypothetical protein
LSGALFFEYDRLACWLENRFEEYEEENCFAFGCHGELLATASVFVAHVRRKAVMFFLTLLLPSR